MGLKICMLAYSFYENDNRVRRYAEALASNGDIVDIISLKKSKDESTYNALNGVNVFRVQTREGNEKGKFSYLFRLILFFIKSFISISFRHIRSPYDIVHVHSVPDFEVFAALIPKIFGAKIILDIHDPVPDFFCAKFNPDKGSIFFSLLCFVEWISAKFSDHVITVTHYWRDVIAARSGIPHEKISVIINLPDTDLFNIEKIKKIGRSSNCFTIIYPGTLNKHCGVDLMLKAVSMIKKDLGDFQFLIYGKGSEYDNLCQMINDLDISQYVFLKGIVPIDEVPQLMSQADIGIALLSGLDTYSQQALNVKLFEFLAMGLPAIATRTKSTEFYLNEDIVLFSEPNNSEDIARCIKELFLYPETRQKLSENGLEYIKANNWNLLRNKYFKIINNLKRSNL